MGMVVSVYKNGRYDCTMDGVSSKVDGLTLVNVEGPFDPSDAYPAAQLIKTRAGVVVVAPMDYDKKWYMFGGNYAATSDSRFSRAVEKLLGQQFYGAVAIHDRCEG